MSRAGRPHRKRRAARTSTRGLALVASTWLALLAPRRAIPILLIVVPLVYAQGTLGYGGVLPMVIGAVMCGTFVLVGPLAWRGLFPTGERLRYAPVRLLAFALIGAVCVLVTGVLLPELVMLRPSMLTAPTESHFITMAMFWVGGWGLGRDIDLEERLVLEKERAEELAKEAERAQLMALRSHLDPHFLFNTLNAIAEWCREDGEVAERAVLELSSMLRAVLAGVRTPTWPFAKEVEVLETLFSLHRLRDPDLFTLTLSIDDDARDVPVPTLIFLPIAENAMKHGPSAGFRGPVSLTARLCEHGGAEALEVVLENPGPYRGRRDGGEGIAMVETRLDLATDGEGAWSIEEVAGGEVNGASGPRTRSRLVLPTDLPALDVPSREASA